VKYIGKNREQASILIGKLPFKSWHINSKNTTTFSLEIRMSKDLNTEEKKSIFIKTIYAGLKAIESNMSFVSYISTDKINTDSWGYGCITQETKYSKD
jgi:transposase-like protein